MPCKTHEIFYPRCGHVYRCEEPPDTVLPTYDQHDPRRFLAPHVLHTSLPAHPCSKHLPRTISSADRSPIGSWRLCPDCEGGPKLPEVFKLQKFSDAKAYWEMDWDETLEELREYYDEQIRSDALVEWLFGRSLGSKWDVLPGGSYEWEKDAGKTKSCRERTEAQQVRDD